MTYEEERLRRMLAERSEEVPAEVNRLDVLHRRIARQRRVRAGGAVAAVLVAATSVSLGVAAVRPDRPVPPPQAAASAPAPSPTVTASPTPTPADDPLPEYLRGHHRVLVRELTLPKRPTLTFTFTPDSADFMLGLECDDRLATVTGRGPSDHLIEVTVNKRVIGTGDCSSSTMPGPALVDAQMNGHYRKWSDIGVRVGKPVAVSVRVGKPVQKSDGELRPGDASKLAGVLTVGVYDPVPFEKFPLPDRPAQLVDLDAVEVAPGRGGFPDGLGRIDSRTEPSPNGRFEREVVMPLQLDIRICVVAPGRIRVLVDGKEVERQAFYDWTGECVAGSALAREYDLPPSFKVSAKTGEKVRVTVIADSFTAPGWRVGFNRSEIY
ncbi:hypothetical protein ACIBTV_14485 [Micromonospora sp. NPDC049366]|uniref:hypothetical protein n=1 Tax=Micromonospora sp. NPDC049366 TaxID=3364271 RepID=UPI0037881A54